MARIVCIREYRFVQPGWSHPKGYAFDVIDDYFAVEAYAEELERIVVRYRDGITRCRELGHEHKPGGCGGFLSTSNTPPFHADEWQCEYRLRVALECTRTAERTILVRIHLPIDGDL